MNAALAALARIILFALACSLFATAVQATTAAPQYRLTAWSLQQGAPADIWALAQSADGLLWLGTGNGLYRFDGVRFERFDPPPGRAFRSNNITALQHSAGGGLWLGSYAGSVSLLRNGEITHYDTTQGLPEGMVIALAEDADGALWIAGRGGLARLHQGRAELIGEDWNYPRRRADWVLADRAGTLWVSNAERVFYLPRGARSFVDSGVDAGKDATLAQAPDGAIWLSDASGTRTLPPLAGVAAQQPQPARRFATHSLRLLFDRAGNLWGSDAGRGGAYRLRPDDTQAAATAYNRAGGLSADVAVPLLEDREGTVWIGTNLGLNSLHRNNVYFLQRAGAARLPESAAAVDAAGTLWTAHAGTLRCGDTVLAGGLGEVRAIVLGAQGQVWLDRFGRLAQFANGRVIELDPPAASTPEDLRLLAATADGALLAVYSGPGLLRHHGGAWQRVDLGADYAARTPRALAAAADGTVWLGYAGDELLRLRQGDVQRYGTAQGLAVGNIGVITLAGDEVLVAGDGGIARLRGERFQTLPPADPHALTGVSGLVRGGNGDIWLNSASGVVHLAAAELERAWNTPRQAPALHLYDYRDGLNGIALQEPTVPTAVSDGAQRIWLVTNQGLAWLDPADLQRNPVAPALLIDAVHAAGLRHLPRPGLRLPQDTTNIRVEYTATSLAVPDRVMFRHRLRGVDAQWQEAGTRREATYTNLGPGDYSFQVIAANDDGRWNETGATLQFSIAPRFFQTVWFYLLSVLLLAVLAAALYLWRLRLMAERIRLRLEERTGERERIARELHDTLLQGVQGLLLRLQALSFAMDEDDPRRAALDKAVEQARAMAVEGRDKIVALRGEVSTELPLSQALRAIGEELTAAHGAAFRLQLHGNERPLCPPVCEDVLDIAREGLRNAFLHAQAGLVSVELRYGLRSLALRVRDDGRGLDESVLRLGRRDGHWGLVGMRERAERVGARLSLHRLAPQGTEVRLEVPRQVAFGNRVRRWSWLGRRGA